VTVTASKRRAILAFITIFSLLIDLRLPLHFKVLAFFLKICKVLLLALIVLTTDHVVGFALAVKVLITRLAHAGLSISV